jgi:hypothetical protein
MRHEVTFAEAYPNAYEDDLGTIWTSHDDYLVAKEAMAFEGDWWAEFILGWCWKEAEENFALCLKQARRRAFWKRHPVAHEVKWFLWTRWNFLSMFCGIVWRECCAEYRIGPSLAWKLAGDLWLRDGRSKR